MGTHPHHHGASHHKRRHHHLPRLSPTARLSAVIAISATFFTAELAIGLYTHSLALIADSFHYLNDLVSFIVALVAIRISESKTSPKGFSFGWQRAQLLGAFANGVFLAALGLSIALQSLERFISIQRVERPLLVLIVGAVGLVLNIISVLFLHDHHGHNHGGHDHGHTHGTVELDSVAAEEAQVESVANSKARRSGIHAEHRHVSNSQTKEKNKPGKSPQNLGMLGVLLHVVGDAINNIGVMGAAAAIQWGGSSDKRFYADPAASLAIAFMIIATSVPLIKNASKILLQRSPLHVDPADVKSDLETLPGVSSVHELHIWSLDERKSVASAHIVTEDESLDGFFECAKRVGECLHAYGVHSFTLQPEPKSRQRGEGRGSVGRAPENVGEDKRVESSGREVPVSDGDSTAGSDCILQCEDDSCRDFQCCN